MGDNPIMKAIGLKPTDRAAIFHVDDVGMCLASIEAFLELCDFGTVSSGALMAPCPWFREAAARCAKRPGLDLGIHATLTSEWSGYPLLIQMLYCIGKNASENETDETGAKITALVAEASRTIDDAKRADVLHEAQKYLFDEGGYLIPGFSNNIDAHTSKVGGLVKSPYGNFGLFDFSGAHITS